MTVRSIVSTLAAACSLLAGAACAQVSVHDAWVRATVPQQKATGAFMQLTSTQDVRLVQVQSPIAGVAEVHEMALEGDVMKMRALPALPLSAGQPMTLRPGGHHIMLLDLHQQVKPGDTVPLTLTFEAAGGQRHSLQVQATARALGASAPAGHGHAQGHGH
ncbi:copper chaperone PCu(A)C [Melaminivora jejuensis]|uniref:copper chaperone PCu(A)C n=1 Tax=Melaminivora jejuensis TaxID=1267217 RepID=UPI001AE01B0A|nr:copper chaperone PCu(A)C [Melaminivora jejuensis]UHJ65998.1 copper chaperone PCu(A)C [Melaminivora jejuensis]